MELNGPFLVIQSHLGLVQKVIDYLGVLGPRNSHK